MSAVLALTAGLCPLSVAAQDDTQSTFGLVFTEKLLWSDDDTSMRSTLDLSLLRQTRVQNLELKLRGDFDKQISGGFDASFENPFASLSYGLESRNAALDVGASFRSTDVDSLTLLDDPTNPVLVIDSGAREDLSTNLNLDFGREAPFGGTLALNYDQRRYVGSTSPDLLDSDQNGARLSLRFRIDPQATLRSDFAISDLDRIGGVDVRTEEASLGLSLAINPVLSADADLGFTRITQSGTVPHSVEEGLQLGLAVTSELPNGILSGSLRSDIDENGRRTTLRVDRNMELPSGSLAAGLGFSHSENSDEIRPIYSLSYKNELPRGELGLSFRQSFSSSSTGTEVLYSRLSVEYSSELTSLDKFTGRVVWSNSDTVVGTASTSRQINITLDYTRTLTDRWSLTSGYTHSRTQSDGSESFDDEVFVGFRTSLGWRP